ncbi:MAG: hypothetical protein EKK29_21030 [Hyphomicrobiales bacterium]|nr:MAG: hypothetical protein EKK29_21030 [Hyphomicrobiales bacterium]
MIKLPAINRHWVGVAALAMAVIGIGLIGNMGFRRPIETLSQISSDQARQPGSAANPDFISEHFISALRRLPQNVYGYAQRGAQSLNDPLQDKSQGSIASESRNWTEEEWRLASAAVTAYRKGGREALSSAASSDIIWQPPEEITKMNPAASR